MLTRSRSKARTPHEPPHPVFAHRYLYGKFIESPDADAGFVGGQGDIAAGFAVIHKLDGVLVPDL